MASTTNTSAEQAVMYGPSKANDVSEDDGSSSSSSSWRGEDDNTLQRMGSWMFGHGDSLLALRARYGPSKGKFFQNGYGDMDSFKDLESKFREHGLSAFPDIEMKITETDLGMDGEFVSPLANWLPEESKTGHVRIIKPHENIQAKGVCIHFQMTGDQGYDFRTTRLANPLANEGYISVLVIIPHYGVRRPKSQTDFYFESVAHMLICSLSIALEGAKLGQWAAKTFDLPVCFTGISLGGTAAAAASLWYPEDSIACVCLCDMGPRAFLASFMKASIDFHAIGPEAKLKELLDGIAIPEFDVVVNKEKRRVIYHVAASHDQIVSLDNANEFHLYLKSISASTKLQVVAGGHVSSILRAGSLFVQPILESFEMFFEMDVSNLGGIRKASASKALEAPPPKRMLKRQSSFDTLLAGISDFKLKEFFSSVMRR